MRASTLLFATAAWSVLTTGWAWYALGPLRAAADRHWTERATLAMAARRRILVPLVFMVAAGCSFAVTFDAPRWWALPLLAWVGSYPARALVLRQLSPISSLRDWVRASASAGVATWGMVGLVAAGAWAMPSSFGLQGLAVLVATVLVLALYQLVGVVVLLYALGEVRDAPPEIRALVDEEARAIGVHVRRVGVWRQPVANAYARPILRHVVLTDGLLAHFADEELRAIVRHELTHLTEPHWTTAARLGVSTWLAAVVLLAKPVTGAYGVAAMVLVAAGIVLVVRGARGLSQRMESRADEGAAETEAQRQAYARALERLHALNLLPVTHATGASPTHPDLVTRMRAAGVEPSWPVPDGAAAVGPSTPRTWIWVFVVLGAVWASLHAVNATRSPYGPMRDMPSCVPVVMVAVVPDGASPGHGVVEAALRDVGLEPLRGGTYARFLPDAPAPWGGTSTAPAATPDTDEDSGGESGAPTVDARVPAFVVTRPDRHGPHAEPRVELVLNWIPLGLVGDAEAFADFQRTADLLAHALHGHFQDLRSGEPVTPADLARRYEPTRACQREIHAAWGL